MHVRINGSDHQTAILVDQATGLPAPVPTAALARQALLTAVTATGAGAAAPDLGRTPSFHASITGTGAVTATVWIEARNTASGVWATLTIFSLTGTTTAALLFEAPGRYMEYRANVTAITGTGAAVTVTMGG